MLITSGYLVAIIVVLVGGTICWANPSRIVNRWVFTCSAHIALWLVLVNNARTSSDPLFWIRLSSAVGALAHIHFWFVKETITVGSDFSLRKTFRKSIPWVIIAGILFVICFTEYFIPSASTRANRLYGQGYYLYIYGILISYGILIVVSLRQTKFLTGARRLELQVWLLGGCTMAGAILLSMLLGAMLRSSLRLQPYIVLIFYSATAWGVTMHRIFDARHILAVGAQRFLLVLVTAGVAYGINTVLAMAIPSSIAFVISVALTLWLAAELNQLLNSFFKLYPRAAKARQAAFEVGQREIRMDPLLESFHEVLQGWTQTEKSLILISEDEVFRSEGIEIKADSPVIVALEVDGWGTPEQIARQRLTVERYELGRFLEKEGLGALVLCTGPLAAIIIGVQVRPSRRPYTYPEIEQLKELASIVQSSVARCLLSAKAQRAEQLATVGLLGAGVAHEIRNPLVSIKAFVQLLPQHYHDPLFRERFFTLIGGEVARIDQLTEQLMNLAKPRHYYAVPCSLHAIVMSSLELVKPRAVAKAVRLEMNCAASPDTVLTDPNAIRQVILNLCLNAIQAQEDRDTERWVRIVTQRKENGIEVTMTDNGPGIAESIRPRLFEPFRTTKSSGFGLGLAVCGEILSSLNATIAADPFHPGQGATFRMLFPCPPPTS